MKGRQKTKKQARSFTFEEFVTSEFKRILEQLTFCLTSLYTYLPTSFIPLEVAEDMIRILEMLQTRGTLFCNGRHFANEYAAKTESIQVLKSLSERFSLPDITDIRSFCLKGACLIFCTVSSSSKLYTEDMNPLKMLVIDEAAQLKECETAIPLQLPGLRQAILVGDEKQFPEMVHSKICEKANFRRSLFERMVNIGHKKHLLNVQYRMHPAISLFPNREFYENKILDGRNVKEAMYEKRFLKGNIFGCYSFINISNGKEQYDNKHSTRNMSEVYVIAEMVANLYKESVT